MKLASLYFSQNHADNEISHQHDEDDETTQDTDSPTIVSGEEQDTGKFIPYLKSIVHIHKNEQLLDWPFTRLLLEALCIKMSNY